MDNNYVLTASGDLYHWGITGMKWGVRRYQNKDGSLTAAGKKRYKATEEELKAREKVIKNAERVRARQAKLDAKKAELDAREKALVDDDNKTAKVDKKGAGKATAAKSKSVKDMTDEELAQAINRARMEDAYRQLRPEPVSNGQKFVSKMVNEAIIPAAVSAGKTTLQNTLEKVGKDLLKDKVDPNSYEALKKSYDLLKVRQDIDKIKNPNKYLSEEDKTKRQNREFDLEDRRAKMDGYKDAADKANKTRQAAEDARKAKADENARAANEAKSREYYNSTYSQVGGESTRVNQSEPRGLAIYTPPTQAMSNVASRGASYTSGYSDWGTSYARLSSGSSYDSGAKAAYSVIDRYGNEIILRDD